MNMINVIRVVEVIRVAAIVLLIATLTQFVHHLVVAAKVHVSSMRINMLIGLAFLVGRRKPGKMIKFWRAHVATANY